MNVRIESDWTTSCWDIHIFERHGDHLFVAKPSELIFSEVSDYRPGFSLADKIKPWLSIDHHLASDFFSSFAKALSDKGFRNDESVRQIADVLKAKENHLEDMRRLVFQDKK